MESTLAQDVQDTGFGTQSPECLVTDQISSYLLGTWWENFPAFHGSGSCAQIWCSNLQARITKSLLHERFSQEQALSTKPLAMCWRQTCDFSIHTHVWLAWGETRIWVQIWLILEPMYQVRDSTTCVCSWVRLSGMTESAHLVWQLLRHSILCHLPCVSQWCMWYSWSYWYNSICQCPL